MTVYAGTPPAVSFGPGALRRFLDDAVEPLLEFSLPWPPASDNRTWRSLRRGAQRRHVYLAPEVVSYREQVALRLLEQRVPRSRFRRFVGLALHFLPPNVARRDFHNYPKVVLDALQAYGIFEDDALVCPLLVTAGDVLTRGRVDVVLWTPASGFPVWAEERWT